MISVVFDGQADVTGSPGINDAVKRIAVGILEALERSSSNPNDSLTIVGEKFFFEARILGDRDAAQLRDRERQRSSPSGQQPPKNEPSGLPSP